MSPLQKQLIDVPFVGGVDTKSDPKQIPLGKLLVLENATFISPGRLKKRNGYSALGTASDSTDVLTPRALLAYRNELLLTNTNNNLFSYDAATSKWSSRGQAASITVTQKITAAIKYSCINVDQARSPNGLLLTAYEMIDSQSTHIGIGYSLMDSTTGQVVVAPTTLLTDDTRYKVSPRVIAAGNTFWMFAVATDGSTSGDIFLGSLDATAPRNGWSSFVAKTSGTGASAISITNKTCYQIDACVGAAYQTGNLFYLIFNNRLGGTTVWQFNNSSTVFDTGLVASSNSGANTIFSDFSNNIVFAWIDSTDGRTVTAKIVTSTAAVGMLTLVTPTVISSAVTSGSYTSVTGVGYINGFINFYMGYSNGDLTQTTVGTTWSTPNYSTQTTTTLMRGVQPASKAFANGTYAYIPLWAAVAPGSTTAAGSLPQTTWLLMEANSAIIARALVGTGGGFFTNGSINSTTSLGGQTGHFCAFGIGCVPLSNTITFAGANGNLGGYVLGSAITTSTTAICPATISYRLTSTNITATNSPFQFAACALGLNFSDSKNRYSRAEIGLALHTSGGALTMYDGAAPVEQNFHVYPTVSSVTLSSGGALSAGTYSVVAVYEWSDANGQIHRSAPSVPVSFTATAGQKATYVVTTARTTAKSNVLVQFYRAQANGTLYTQVSNFNSAATCFNVTNADTVSYVDTYSDATIQASPELYTTGDVVANAMPPPLIGLTVHQSRLFGIDSTSPQTLRYSKQVVPPGPVEFSDDLSMIVDSRGGDCTALATLDEKLIIFKQARAFVVFGQGPDSTGAQNSYQDPAQISGDVGCAVPKSIVVTPDGLMFQSQKGIYLLDRALQFSYVGAPVEAYNGQEVVNATLASGTTQVRFALSGGSILVYDYQAQQWSVFVGMTPLDACLWKNATYVYLSTSGPMQETTGFSDGGSYISMRAKTAWLKLTGMQGFQRVYNALILGDCISPHRLLVTINYDYSAAVGHFVDGGQPDGGETITGIPVTTGPYQFGIGPAQQKCEAIQFTLQDMSTGVIGESAAWSGITLEIGVIGGARRLPPAQSFG